MCLLWPHSADQFSSNHKEADHRSWSWKIDYFFPASSPQKKNCPGTLLIPISTWSKGLIYPQLPQVIVGSLAHHQSSPLGKMVIMQQVLGQYQNINCLPHLCHSSLPPGKYWNFWWRDINFFCWKSSNVLRTARMTESLYYTSSEWRVIDSQASMQGTHSAHFCEMKIMQIASIILLKGN